MLDGPPDKMSAAGRRASTSSVVAPWWRISEYTRASRTRRAMSCAYCAPKLTTRTGRSVTGAVIGRVSHGRRHGPGTGAPSNDGPDGSADGPEHRRVALAAPAAQPDGGDPSAPSPQLGERGEREPGAGHPDRVAERDGATVHVELVLGDAELVGRGEAHGREGLVDLEQVDVAHLEAGPRQCRRDRPRRLQQQGGVRSGDLPVGDELAERHDAELFGLAAGHHDDGGRAVGDL